MKSTYIYFAALCIITTITFVKHANPMGKILMVLYTFIGFFSVMALKMGLIINDKITFLPYLFLLTVYLISFAPFLFKQYKFSADKLIVTVNKKYIIFAILFILASLVSLKVQLPYALKLLASGDWNENRANLYKGAFTMAYTWYEYYAIQFSSYTRLLGILVGFVLVRSDKKYMWLGFTTILSGASVLIVSAMSQSSRGSIVNIALLLGVLFVFFFNELGNKSRIYFSILIFIGFLAVVPYVVDGTMSRFSDGAIDSLVSYFGQSPVVFNYGVFDIDKLSFGKYAFGNLFDLGNISPSDVGGSWGSGFYTYVGWLYLDWGFIGTIVTASLISWICIRIIRKKTYTVSDIYIVFFVYYSLLQGVFVIGRDYCYNILMTIIIYYFVKVIFDKYTFLIGRYGL